MSLILKGIDLPTKPTQIKIYPNGIIFCANEDGINVPKAQAIQISKDHGRIGDLDELQKAIRTDIMGGLNYEWFIEATPTILEAEE